MLLSLILSCSDPIFFSEYNSVPIDGWASDSAVVFSPIENKTETTFGTTIGVRYTDDYKSRYITLVLDLIEQDSLRLPSRRLHPKYKLKDSHLVQTDTVTLELFDDKSNRTGKGFAFATTEVPGTHLHLSANKTYKIHLHHIMRENPLNGITDVGVKLK